MATAEAYPEAITYTITTPDQIDTALWADIQEVERAAYRHALMNPDLGYLQRSAEDVDHLVHWGDLEGYIRGRQDPNTRVGDDLFEGQQYYDMHTVLAFDRSDVVGALHTAMNVSGRLQWLKKHDLNHKYLWQGSIAVHPDVQGEDVALTMEMIELNQRDRRFKTSAFVWPELNGQLYTKLVNAKFEEMEVFDGTPFGKNRPKGPVKVARMVGNVGMAHHMLKPVVELRKGVFNPRSEAIRHAVRSMNNHLLPQPDYVEFPEEDFLEAA